MKVQLLFFTGIHLTEIQQQLGEAVNALVKYFYASAEGRSRGELTQLLCAPGKGFVSVMVVVFMYGRQDSIWSARLFRSYYPWDYIGIYYKIIKEFQRYLIFLVLHLQNISYGKSRNQSISFSITLMSSIIAFCCTNLLCFD